MPLAIRILGYATIIAIFVGGAAHVLKRPRGIPMPESAPPAAAMHRDIKTTPPAAGSNRRAEGVVHSLPSNRLLLPVAGVKPSALRDAYTEARSGGREHQAIDIMAPRGSEVVSAADGVLLKLHNSALGGLMVYAADATDSFIFMYGHLDAYATGLVPGMSLRRGQLLGYVGSTGNVSPNAPHLHFAISRGKPSERWWSGTPLNPYPLLAHAAVLDSTHEP
jgi:peptidoglycan LD-endopeptidase LytH